MQQYDFTEAGSMDRYIWCQLLSTFLGWDKAQIEKCADQFEPDLSNENSLHHHESSIWYVSPLLIPKDIADSLSFIEFRDLRLRIEGIIFPSDPPWKTIEELQAHDWGAAKQRLDSFIAVLRSELAKGDRANFREALTGLSES